MDGFDQDDATGKRDDGGVVLRGFLAAQGDALEAFELADGLLDTGAGAVQRLGEETGRGPGIRAVRDDRADAAPGGGLAVGPGIVALVGNDSARPDVGADVEQGLELRAVAGLPAGQLKVEWMAVEIGLQMDLA